MARKLVVAIALLASSARAQYGDGRCPCIGMDAAIPRYACSEAFASSTGECVRASGREGSPAYPGDYGGSCKKHLEPDHSSCYNLTTATELAVGARKGWCDDAWCYVDPCACGAEATTSLYFSETDLFYSYATCGAADAYTEEETDLSAGNAECRTSLRR